MKKTIFVFLFLFCMYILPAKSDAAPPSSEGESGLISLSASPSSPRPGDTVRITARVSPPFDPGRNALRWKWRGDAANVRAISQSEVACEVQNGSVTLIATLRDILKGEDIETASLTLTPLRYSPGIRNLTSERTTIRVWDDATKSVVEKTGRAAQSRTVLEAVLDPRPAGAVRYVWTPGDGTVLASEDGPRVTVFRNLPGTASLSVTILDRNGLELGHAETSFDVDISSEAVERSAHLDRGLELRKKALALRDGDRAEDALIQAEAAAEELTEGGMKDDSLRDELERFRLARDNYFRALELGSAAASLWRDGRTEEALLKYREAQALYSHPQTEKSIAELEKLVKREKDAGVAAAAAAREAEQLAGRGKLDEALKKYEESLQLYPHPAVRLARANLEGRINALARKVAAAEAQRSIALAFEKQGDLENALSKITESQEIHPLPDADTDEKRIRAALQEQQRRRDEAVRLEKDAALLETRALEGQGDPEMLERVLDRYRQASEIWPSLSSEQAIRRVGTHIARIRAQNARVVLLQKEAAQLEQEGRMEEAMHRYLRAQDVRRTDETRNRIADLERRMEVRRKRMQEAQVLHDRALDLERQGELDEALATARKGESIFSDNVLSLTVKRLQKSIETRNDRISRAAALADRAQEAQMRGDSEKALDLYIESENTWHDEEIVRTIRTLRGLVSESANAAGRAEELYKEAVILERNSSPDRAEEKLRTSLALHETPEARQLLEKVQKTLAVETWIGNLKTQPLSLRVAPSLPRTGERTVVRIESGAWTNDANLGWRWKVTGNVLGGEILDRGRAYGFYPADTLPVTLALSALQTETGREILTCSISVTAKPYDVTLTADTGARSVKLWNDALKCLENVPEYPTGTDIEIRAEIEPLPDGSVSWLWNADPDSVIPASRDSRTTVRRALPGTSKLSVTAKDARGIVLGTAQLGLLISVDRNDVARDARRAQAWAVWMEARSQWESGKFLQALETARRAAALDPSASGIANGRVQMEEDYGKSERFARLLADSSGLMISGKTEEAAEKEREARTLRPDVSAEALRLEIDAAAGRARENSLLAAGLRAEGEALLAKGAGVQALIRFQDSLLLEENDAVSRDVARLVREIAEEKTKRREAEDLRRKGNLLADKKHYTEALELYSRSLLLHPDPWLRSYMDILEEKSGEEKKLRERAAVLRRAGDALAQEKKTEEALNKYRESLRIWHDEDLDRRVRDEEKRIAAATASGLRKEAESLLKRKKTAEALAKYRESLKFAWDETADIYVKKADAAEIKKRVEELTREGDALMKQKKPQEALERYRIALTKVPQDPELTEKVRKLELILKPAVAEENVSEDNIPEEFDQKSLPEEPSSTEDDLASGDSRDPVQANALFREGNSLYREKKYREALQKYQESYKFSQSPKLKEFIDQLESALENAEQATRLVQEGNRFYNNRDYKNALDRYRESLKFNKNPEVEAFILKVEPLAK